jgi:protein arginine kinase activator
MKCEICNKNDASVHFKQVFEGAVKEMFVCEVCAKANGFDPKSPMSLTDFLFGVGTEQENMPAEGDTMTCPQCGMRQSDFRKKSRLGCASCYEAFSDEIMPLLMAMHKGVRHVGKVPANARVSHEISNLKVELDDAVADQRFEDAAMIRDRLVTLKQDVSNDS